MEQWSILSNVVNYVQYDKHPKNFHNLNVSTVNKEKYKRTLKIEEEQRQEVDVDFGDTPETLKRIFRCIQRNTIRNTEHY